jgi:hypothetical protein
MAVRKISVSVLPSAAPYEKWKVLLAPVPTVWERT